MAKQPDEFDIADFDAGGDSFEVNEGQSYDPAPGDMPPPNTPPSYSAPASSTGKASNIDKKVVNLTSDIPVQVVAVLGKKNVTVKDIVSMKMGQVLELNRLPNEAIDLVANGKLIAKGELVEIEGRLGVRVLKIFD